MPVAAVRAIAPGGVDHAFEAVGSAATIRLAWDVLRPGATATIVGIAPLGVEVSLPAIELIYEKGIRGSYYGSGDAATVMTSMADDIVAGRFPIADVVSHFTDLDGIEAAFEPDARRRGRALGRGDRRRDRGSAGLTELTPLERRVTDAIAGRRGELCDLVCDLVAFDTRAPGPDLAPRDEAALQEYVAGRMRAAGLAVRVWEPEPADLPPSRYPIPPGHDFRGRPQLLATATGAGGGRTLLFNGHVDVVTAEPRELWASDPFVPELRDGRVHGRGACDMKGGVAAMLLATEVLRALDVPLAGDLVVNTVTDEESTGAGSLAVAASGLRADGGIIPEPTSLQAWLGARGSLMPAITVEGRAGHAGLAPEHWTAGGPVNARGEAAGRDRRAAAAAARMAAAAGRAARGARSRRHRARRRCAAGSGWSPTRPRRRSSATSSTCPGQADADGCGTRVEAEIEAHVLAAAQADPWLALHPPRFAWAGDVPAGWVEPGEPVAATALDAMAALGLPPAVSSRTTFFDGPTFTRAGIPTIAFGPGDIAEAHAIDESVPVDELVRAAQVLAVAAMRFCGLAA